MAAPNYDVMELEDEAQKGEAPEGDASDLDAEFLMHAQGAGFDEAQARSLKLAIERCNALQSEGAYEAAEDEDDDFEE